MDWMTAVYTDEMRTIAVNITGRHRHLADDLFGYVFDLMVEKPEKEINKIHRQGKIKGYFIRAMYYQFNDTSSDFSKKFRSKTAAPDPGEHDYEKDRKIEMILKKIDTLEHHEQLTLLSVINYESLTEMEKATGIHRKWLSETMKTIREKVK